MSMMRLCFVVGVAMIATTSVRGDTLTDCKAVKLSQKTVPACTEVINAGQASSEDLAWAYFNRGTVLGIRGQLEESIGDLKRAVQLNSNWVAPYSNLVMAYSSKGDIPMAIETANELVAHNSQSASSYYTRGTLFMRANQPKMAAPDYGKAIELDPTNREAYLMRGRALAWLKNHDQAMADFSRAIEIDPKYSTAYYYRGMLFLDYQSYDLALKDFDKALEMNPQDLPALIGRGDALSQKGDREAAIVAYRKALAVKPNVPQILAKLQKLDTPQTCVKEPCEGDRAQKP